MASTSTSKSSSTSTTTTDPTAPAPQDKEVQLAHHWRDPLTGTDYAPGATAKVTEDQLRELVGAGYVAGVDPDVPEQRAKALGLTPPATEGQESTGAGTGSGS